MASVPEASPLSILLGSSRGIYELCFDASSMTLTISASFAADRPTWVLASPADATSFYSANEHQEGNGSVTKYHLQDHQFEATWTVACSSGGTAHCSALVFHGREALVAANYEGGTVDLIQDGKLLQSIKFNSTGPRKLRQESSHCHQAIMDTLGAYLYVVDLGGDAVHQYKIMEGGLEEQQVLKTRPGQGPRHIAFHPILPNTFYVLCELSNEIIRCQIDHYGKIQIKETCGILPEASMQDNKREGYPQPPTAGELQVSEDTHWIYASNRYLTRGPDTIFVAPLDRDGRISSFSQKQIPINGTSPRHFDIRGKWLVVALKDSNCVKLYELVNGDLRFACQLDSGIEDPSCAIFI